MEREYSPDKWVIVKFTKNDKDFYKVLGGWSGGYLDADHWRLSSGLERITEDGDYYLMHNYSGSIYKCHKNAEGLTSLSSRVYNGWVEESNRENLTLAIVNVEDFNKTIEIRD